MIRVRNDDQLSFKDAPPYEPTVALGESPGAEQREAMLADLEDVDAPDAFVTADD
jgi:hypothetical protein